MADDRRNERVVREGARQRGVELRPAALEVVRHAAEDLADRLVPQASRAAFAWAAIFEKAAGSSTAMSASTLRSSLISALRQPATNWLYDSPSRLAAALILMIQRRRKTRFFFFRSRYAWTSDLSSC